MLKDEATGRIGLNRLIGVKSSDISRVKVLTWFYCLGPGGYLLLR